MIEFEAKEIREIRDFKEYKENSSSKARGGGRRSEECVIDKSVISYFRIISQRW